MESPPDPYHIPVIHQGGEKSGCSGEPLQPPALHDVQIVGNPGIIDHDLHPDPAGNHRSCRGSVCRGCLVRGDFYPDGARRPGGFHLLPSLRNLQLQFGRSGSRRSRGHPGHPARGGRTDLRLLKKQRL